MFKIFPKYILPHMVIFWTSFYVLLRAWCSKYSLSTSYHTRLYFEHHFTYYIASNMILWLYFDHHFSLYDSVVPIWFGGNILIIILVSKIHKLYWTPQAEILAHTTPPQNQFTSCPTWVDSWFSSYLFFAAERLVLTAEHEQRQLPSLSSLSLLKTVKHCYQSIHIRLILILFTYPNWMQVVCFTTVKRHLIPPIF